MKRDVVGCDVVGGRTIGPRPLVQPMMTPAQESGKRAARRFARRPGQP
jgi:hypothetical protein